MTIGFRILKRQRQVDQGTVARFRDLPVANISDVMSRMSAGGSRLRPYHTPGGVMSGPAFTVRTRPGDNLMMHKALNLANPGDVLVVDGGGELTNALTGEMMLAYCKHKGLAGVVIDGAVRDLSWIRQGTFPVYAAGITHRGPYKNGPGEINVPVAIDGMVIEPGDLVVGDEDGLLCIPFDHTEEIYKAAVKKHEAENKQMAEILAGISDRSWVDNELKRLGVAEE